MRYIFTIVLLIFIGCGSSNTTSSNKKIDENSSSRVDINTSQEENTNIDHNSSTTNIVADNNETNNTLVDNISTEDEISSSVEEEDETTYNNNYYSGTSSSTPTTDSSSLSNNDSSSNNPTTTGDNSLITESDTSTNNNSSSETDGRRITEGNSDNSTTESRVSITNNSSSEENDSTSSDESNNSTNNDSSEEDNSTSNSSTEDNRNTINNSSSNTTTTTGNNSSEEDDSTSSEDNNNTTSSDSSEDDNSTSSEDNNNTTSSDSSEDNNSTSSEDNNSTTSSDSSEDDNSTSSEDDNNTTSSDSSEENNSTLSKDDNSTTSSDSSEENNSTSSEDDNSTTSSDLLEENNSTSNIENNNSVEDTLGKAQLGVIAEATVNIYEINGKERTLIAQETTSSGDTIDSIGNFKLHLTDLNDSKFYIYEVIGGEDWDVEDDGIINRSPTKNRGTFNLIARGDTLKQTQRAKVTIVSEIIYQKVKPYIGEETISEKLNQFSKEIIAKDIDEDENIDIYDILNYDPIEHKLKLSNDYNYTNHIKPMVENILNDRDINYTEPITIDSNETNSSLTEEYIQEELDSGNYDYVISQLTENKDAYKDLDNDEININIAGAYVGKSGYTVYDITNAIGDSSNLNGFVSNTTKDNDPVDTINQLKKADEYYSNVVDGLDCSNTDNLTEEQKSSCFNLGLVRLTSLSNSVKLLFGGDEDIIKKWADGVNLNSTDDLNGNSVIDESDASACAIVYASNPSNNCRDGSMATYRKKVTFSKDGVNYNTTMIDVDVGSSKLGYKTFNKLVTNRATDNSALLTDGVCDINFTKTAEEIDGVKYFPCPVINNGELMNIADSLTNTSNIQSLFPAGSQTRETIDSYIQNITGSKDGIITQDNLSTYLKSH